jgi:AcrR family transcriptional regulator
MPSVTRRQATPTRRSGAELRLVEATERLLGEGTSFIALSVEQLCSEAGIARSTFYVHFRDKGDLVIRVAARMLEQLSDASAAWWAEGTDRDELLAATRRLVDVYARHRAVFAALTETAAYDPELRAVQEGMVDAHAEPLARMIEAGRKRGAVRDLHTSETVVALVGMVQVSCDRLADGTDEQLDRLAETITAVTWHALFPDDRPPADGTSA